MRAIGTRFLSTPSQRLPGCFSLFFSTSKWASTGSAVKPTDPKGGEQRARRARFSALTPSPNNTATTIRVSLHLLLLYLSWPLCFTHTAVSLCPSESTAPWMLCCVGTHTGTGGIDVWLGTENPWGCFTSSFQ